VKVPPAGRVDGRGVDGQCGDHRLDGTLVELPEELLQVRDRPVVEADRS
jgi:hypothetical protein